MVSYNSKILFMRVKFQNKSWVWELGDELILVPIGAVGTPAPNDTAILNSYPDLIIWISSSV